VESGNPAYEAHVLADQSVVLQDIGEARVGDGSSACLEAFDVAESLLPSGAPPEVRPYVALDAVHLVRWRGHAMARLGNSSAVDVLTDTLRRHDPTYRRAEVSMRVDLASALITCGRAEEAARQLRTAEMLAHQLGSYRQLHRATRVASRLPDGQR
jgi:hypothetical protein